jgi:hypothetical protein
MLLTTLHDTPHKSVFDLPFARCAPAGEPGSAPPNRRGSTIRKKSPKFDSSGPPIMALAVPHLERLALALAIVRPETVVAWHRKGFRLFWTWKIRHGQPGRPVISRELRDLIRKMCRENPSWGAPRIHGELLKLGIDIGESSVSKYMVRNRKPPSQTSRTFLENHAQQLVSILHRLLHGATIPCGQKTRRGPSPPKKQIPRSNQCLGVRCLQLAGR